MNAQEKESRNRINYVVLCWCTVFAVIFIPRDLVITNPLWYGFINTFFTLLVFPYFSSLWVNHLIDSNIGPLTLLGKFLYGLARISMEISRTIDNIMKIFPHNPYSSCWESRKLTLAQVLNRQVKCNQAIKLLNSLIKDLLDSRENITVLIDAIRTTSEIQEGLDLLEEAENLQLNLLEQIEKLDRIVSGEEWGKANSLGLTNLNLAAIYSQKQQFDKALEFAKTATREFRADNYVLPDTRLSNISIALENVYSIANYSLKFKESLIAAQQFYELEIERQKERDHPNIALAYLYLSESHFKLDYLEEALAFALKAEELYKNINKEDFYLKSFIAKCLGDAYYKLEGDVKKAQTHYLQSFEARKECTNTSKEPSLPEIFVSLARTFRELGKEKDATKNYLLSVHCSEFLYGISAIKTERVIEETSAFLGEFDQLELAIYFKEKREAISKIPTKLKGQIPPHNELDSNNSYWNDVGDIYTLIPYSVLIWLIFALLVNQGLIQIPNSLLTALNITICLLIAPFFLFHVALFLGFTKASMKKVSGIKLTKFISFLQLMLLELNYIANKINRLIPNNPYAQSWVQHSWALGFVACDLKANFYTKNVIRRTISDLKSNKQGEPINFIEMKNNLVCMILSVGLTDEAIDLASNNVTWLLRRRDRAAIELYCYDLSHFFIERNQLEQAIKFAHMSMAALQFDGTDEYIETHYKSIMNKRFSNKESIEALKYCKTTLDIKRKRVEDKISSFVGSAYCGLALAFNQYSENKSAKESLKLANLVLEQQEEEEEISFLEDQIEEISKILID